MFAKGYIEAEGFEPSADLLAKRGKSLIKQNASVIIVEKSSEKPSKMESKNRSARDTSESSGASNSTERKSRQSKSQNLKPKEAEEGQLSYDNCLPDTCRCHTRQ